MGIPLKKKEKRKERKLANTGVTLHSFASIVASIKALVTPLRGFDFAQDSAA
jgi:hypothetical protein